MLTERDFEPYLERLFALPFVTEARVLELGTRRGNVEIDAVVVVRTPAGKTMLAAELKRTHLTAEVGERLINVRHTIPDLLVLAPFVGRDLADRFGRAKVNFVDLAGNCHVEVGDRYYAHIEGRRPESKPPTARAMRGPAYQVLFALLAKPDLTTAPARVLADAAGKVSPQTALDARRRFRERGLLVGPPDAMQWASRGYRQGLDTFLAGFADTLAASLIVGRYRARQRDVRDLEEALTPRLDASASWRWGGGAACERLTGYYRGDTTVIYVDDARPKLAADLHLVVDRQGPITIMRAPGPLAFESPKSDTVHPLLAWADLLVEGEERATEAAGEIYNRYLARLTP